jgi:PAS domain S-box-containing protein
MGGGVSKAERRKREQQRHKLKKNVERFVINVYATCPRMESMRLILSSEMAIRAFNNFVIAERAEENLNLYMAVRDLKKQKLTTYNMSKEAEKIFKSYIQVDTQMQVMISTTLCQDYAKIIDADKDDSNYIPDLNALFERLLEEALFLMARDQFHRFILSKYYKTWRAAESSHAIAATSEDHSQLTEKEKKPVKTEMSMVRSISVNGGKKGNKKNEDLSVRAFQNLDASEITRILGSENWLAVLLAAVEALPISFALATARRDRRGYPLMYVNKYFEKVTGFNRSDVLGKNCRFLQCDESEKPSIQQMSDALRNGTACQVIITNRRVDGEVFKNVVALKPVYDDKKVLCYFMSVQIDVSREVDDYVSKLRLATDLMEMLPDIIISEDDESSNVICYPRS